MKNFNVKKPFLLKQYLVNLGLFLSTLPYVAPIPINTDVQYPVFVICAAIVVMDFAKMQNRFRLEELYFLFIAIFSFVYVNPFYEYDYEVVKRAGLIGGFLVFYVFSKYWFLTSHKVFFAGVVVNFIGAVWHYCQPALFSGFASSVTRTIKFSSLEGSRGVSGFSPEPGFLGGMSVFFILISWVYLKQNRSSAKAFYFVLILSLIMTIFTKSGTSSLFIAVLLIVSITFGSIKLRKKLFLIFVVFLFSCTLLTSVSPNSRGFDIANKLMTDPYSVFVIDQSVAYRGLAISVGALSITQGYILGHGVGSYRYVAAEIVSRSQLAELYSHVISNVEGILSALSQYVVELGCFFIFLLCLLYYKTKPLPYVLIVRICSILFILASFSILFPPYWILLAATSQRVLTYQTRNS